MIRSAFVQQTFIFFPFYVCIVLQTEASIALSKILSPAGKLVTDDLTCINGLLVYVLIIGNELCCITWIGYGFCI